jgi:hypothetical protein
MDVTASGLTAMLVLAVLGLVKLANLLLEKSGWFKKADKQALPYGNTATSSCNNIRLSQIETNLISVQREMRSGFEDVKDSYKEVCADFKELTKELRDTNREFYKLNEALKGFSTLPSETQQMNLKIYETLRNVNDEILKLNQK